MIFQKVIMERWTLKIVEVILPHVAFLKTRTICLQLVNGVQFKKRRCHLDLFRFAFTANAGMNFNIDICNVLEFFYKYFDNELIDIITTETNRYAEERAHRLHSKPWCSTFQNEIRVFWGILILQGVIKKNRSARLLE